MPTVKGSPRGQWLSICGQDREWLMLPWRWEVSWRQPSSGWMVGGYELQVGHDFSLEISVKVYLFELSAPYIYIDFMFKRCNICSNIHFTDVPDLEKKKPGLKSLGGKHRNEKLWDYFREKFFSKLNYVFWLGDSSHSKRKICSQKMRVQKTWIFLPISFFAPGFELLTSSARVELLTQGSASNFVWAVNRTQDLSVFVFAAGLLRRPGRLRYRAHQLTRFLVFFQGNKFEVKAGDLSFSVALYTITAILGIMILMARRYIGFLGKAELGGPVLWKWVTFVLLIGMWMMYVLLSSLQVYGHINPPF